MKAPGSTWELHLILPGLSMVEVAKAASWTNTDAEVRKRGEQTGLDTLVVHAVNDVD